ncbi:hypothetical protein, partial [Nocardia farcinica]|uniref:hypothetical protein n=1 Tax=Nocardia farcinica TaxID=37329 RepID=UPI002455720B
HGTLRGYYVNIKTMRGSTLPEGRSRRPWLRGAAPALLAAALITARGAGGKGARPPRAPPPPERGPRSAAGVAQL